MTWGKEWLKPVEFIDSHLDMPKQPWPEWPVPEQAKQAIANEEFKTLPELGDSRRNKTPTHDPYTNPGAFLYYQCECGQVLDPKVKSFAALNNHASKADWKIRWGAQHYVPYCPKCVVEKGIE